MFQKCKGLRFHSTVLRIVKLFIEAEFWMRSRNLALRLTYRMTCHPTSLNKPLRLRFTDFPIIKIRRLILLCICVCEIIAFVIKFLPSVIYGFAFYPEHKKMCALEKSNKFISTKLNIGLRKIILVSSRL